MKDVDMEKPAFQVDITLPNPVTQLFVEDKKVFHVFTGADEKLMCSLALSIQENDSSGVPKVP